MARNVEIKARARDFERQARLAASLSNRQSERSVQQDTFFTVPRGRLKLREFGDGGGELIYYERPDAPSPTESRYVRSATEDPETLKTVLLRALGMKAVIRKTRTVHLSGQTRIHLDQVEGLGEFIELEVVLADRDDFEQGAAIARDLMARLAIAESDLVAEAYVDMLGQDASRRPPMDDRAGK